MGFRPVIPFDELHVGGLTKLLLRRPDLHEFTQHYIDPEFDAATPSIQARLATWAQVGKVPFFLVSGYVHQRSACPVRDFINWSRCRAPEAAGRPVCSARRPTRRCDYMWLPRGYRYVPTFRCLTSSGDGRRPRIIRQAPRCIWSGSTTSSLHQHQALGGFGHQQINVRRDRLPTSHDRHHKRARFVCLEALAFETMLADVP